MPGQQIPGAPGFYAPRDMTPEEFDAWLARIRFGGSSMKGDASSIPDDDGGPESNIPNYTPPGPVTELDRQAAVNRVDPAVVRQFLSTMKSPTNTPESLDYSFTKHQQEAMGHTSPNFGPPQTMAEYDTLYNPNVYDLPEDVQHRNMFNERIKAQAAMDAADQKGQAALDLAAAKGKEAEARGAAANLQQALGDIYREHPELASRTAQGARMVGGYAPDPETGSLVSDLLNGGKKPTQTIGKQVYPGVTPERDVRPGDWTVRGGKKYMFDGRSWSPI